MKRPRTLAYVPDTIRDAEFNAMMRTADPGTRYAYALKRIADRAALCWLESDLGRCVLGPDEQGRTILPIWPHPRYAATYAAQDPVAARDWAGAEPIEIDVHEFIDEDLPALLRDGYAVTVFPVPPGQSAVASAAEFAQHLRHELDQVE